MKTSTHDMPPAATSGKRQLGLRFAAGLVLTLACTGLAAISTPTAIAAPDCSKPAIDSTVNTVTQQARSYLNSHPEGNRMLMLAALQPRPQAEATVRAYAAANPEQYAEFSRILSPLGPLQRQCGVQVIPAEYQWAFDQFVGS